MGFFAWFGSGKNFLHSGTGSEADPAVLAVDIQNADVTLDPTNLATAAKQDEQTALLAAAIPAGANHIGEVGGNTVCKKIALTVDTSAYTAGDCVGGVQTVTNWARASGIGTVLQDVIIEDLDGINPTGYLMIFDAEPSGSTLTDADAASIAAADQAKRVACIKISSGDWMDEAAVGGISHCELRNLGKTIIPAATSVWVAFVTDGTPDFTTASALTISLGLLRD